jgi:hypothetical protein
MLIDGAYRTVNIDLPPSTNQNPRLIEIRFTDQSDHSSGFDGDCFQIAKRQLLPS